MPQRTSCTSVSSRGALQLAELPAEILLLVLAQLALTDVSHMACSCARLHSLLLEEDLWSKFMAEPELHSNAGATPGQANQQGLPAVPPNSAHCAELAEAVGPVAGSLEASCSSGEQLRAITDADGRKRYVKASAAEVVAAPAAGRGSAAQFPQLRGLLRSHLCIQPHAPELLPGAGWLLAKTLTRAGQSCRALAVLSCIACLQSHSACSCDGMQRRSWPRSQWHLKQAPARRQTRQQLSAWAFLADP